jgi:dienelactone hydrolase
MVQILNRHLIIRPLTRLLVTLLLMFCASCKRESVSPGLELQAEDYKTARSHFQTHLVRHGAAPQSWTSLRTPADADEVLYCKDPPLKAWVSKVKNKPAAKNPAVLFLHGGFAADIDDWEMPKPYREAGYTVMMPMLRGENGQPGDYSLFYDELSDVLKAAEFLAARPEVDASHIYVAGHSIGGTLTLLAAMSSDRFCEAASFSGSADQIAWSSGQPEIIPFDRSNVREFQMRSPIAFATSFKCPVRIYYGSSERFFSRGSQQLASLAQQAHLDVMAISVPGDHFSAVPREIQQSIEFFCGR